MLDKNSYKKIGERLIELREGKNLNQTQAANVIGIPQRTYQNYEYGLSKPNTKYLKKIIDYYGCDYSWLLTGEGVPYPVRPEDKPDTPGDIPKFNDIFDDYKDLPDNQLTVLIDHLKSLSRNDRKRIISDLITSTRRGGIDALLLRKIYAVLLEFLQKNGKSAIDSYDFMFAMTLQTIYRELEKSPTEQELMSVIEPLYVVGKVFPHGVPLTPHEQLELFSWGQIPALKGEKS